MNALPEPTAINEIDAAALRADPARWIQAAQPWVVRSLVDDWPLVSAANQSDSAFLDYLLGFYSGNQVSAFLGEADIGGRFFYNEALDGFNFLQVQTTLNHLSGQLRALATDESPPSLYMGSTNLDHWLPGLSGANPLPIDLTQPLASLWLGNHSLIAPHFDFPLTLPAASQAGGASCYSRPLKSPTCMWGPGTSPRLVKPSAWWTPVTLICSCTRISRRR
ncbi:MAG: hypothetical protein CM15mP74_08410 [Halieaceae bacterium]|nr:MAG: hypothetical protein CM15mP74_08410 [Halieaceae bacterium]